MVYQPGPEILIMIQRIFILSILVMMLFPVTDVPAAALTFRDKMGRTVTVQTPVKRAVLYETYELLPVTGAWDRVAGLSRYAFENDLLLAVKPDLARLLPSAGSAMDLNAEALLRLKPDVVITWSINPNAVRFLESKGLTVIAVYPESIPELYEVMRLQGRLFGREKKIDSAIARMEEMFSLIRKRVATVPPTARKKALYLSGKPTTVSGKVGINQDLFTLIGLKNGGNEINQRSAEVSLEQIAAWNPDLIYIWGSARYSAVDLLKNPQWRHIKAVKERGVRKAPKWGTWSPRLAPIALWMASRAYPERFKDIDITKTIDRFYRDVYGIPYAKVTQIER
jgi:iron complex transport system substrate-binding protein